jgi:hypothetical protein
LNLEKEKQAGIKTNVLAQTAKRIDGQIGADSLSAFHAAVTLKKTLT